MSASVRNKIQARYDNKIFQNYLNFYIGTHDDESDFDCGMTLEEAEFWHEENEACYSCWEHITMYPERVMYGLSVPNTTDYTVEEILEWLNYYITEEFLIELFGQDYEKNFIETFKDNLSALDRILEVID